MPFDHDKHNDVNATSNATDKGVVVNNATTVKPPLKHINSNGINVANVEAKPATLKAAQDLVAPKAKQEQIPTKATEDVVTSKSKQELATFETSVSLSTQNLVASETTPNLVMSEKLQTTTTQSNLTSETSPELVTSDTIQDASPIDMAGPSSVSNTDVLIPAPNRHHSLPPLRARPNILNIDVKPKETLSLTPWR